MIAINTDWPAMHLPHPLILASLYQVAGVTAGVLIFVVCGFLLLRRQLFFGYGRRVRPTTRPGTQYLDENLYRGGREVHERIFKRHAGTSPDPKPPFGGSVGNTRREP